MSKKIDDSKFKEMIYFAVNESIKFSKKSHEDYALAVEKKLKSKYNLSRNLAAIIERPVYWYLSIESKLIPFDGCAEWHIDESACVVKEKELKTAAVYLMSKHRDYFLSNFITEGYKIQSLGK